MPLPRLRPQFRLRTLMLAVAVGTVVFGASRIVARYRWLMALAAPHETWTVAGASGFRDVMILPYDHPYHPGQRIHIRRYLWHVEMGKKYRHAAWRPWLTVPPDTPEPE